MESRFQQRILAILSSLGLWASLVPVPVGAAIFTDVSGSTPYSRAIEALKEKGVLEGNPDGSYKPKNTINRAELLKIVMESRGDVSAGSNCFPDVKDEWFAKYVCTAKAEGIVAGYPDGMFHPENEVNFPETSKIFALAYGQDIPQYSADWYEPYVRALETSKAIPLSIDAIDEKIDRSEMAEMMWRLSEDVTTEPSQGYLNVKYPDTQVNFASDEVQYAKSCADLRAVAEEAQRAQGGGGMYYLRDSDTTTAPAPASVANESAADKAQSGGGSDGTYSSTNVQVEGVDEADIIKTDGNYVYVVRGQTVKIIDVTPATDMKEVSTIDLEDSSFSPTEIYVDANKLVVVGSSWVQSGGPIRIMEDMPASKMIWPGYNTSKAQVRIYDISDKTQPKELRKVSFDGYGITSRRIEDKLYFVVNQPTYWYGRPMPLEKMSSTEDSFLPRFEDSAKGTSASAVVNCNKVAILPHVPSPEYLTVGVIPLNNVNEEVKRSTILGNAQNVYASLENLYVAATQWQYYWDSKNGNSEEKTNVYRFEMNDAGVELKAQGSVPGHLLNQFSMDENGNQFRVATTVNAQWRPDGKEEVPSKNNLYVLGMDMKVQGKLQNLAPGEQIYSTRFIGDRAYMVTFRTIDPLFVIDLSNPAKPEVLGSLKIPGFSNYLHPYDENHILGFGKDADESSDGTFAFQKGLKVALFDVTDVANPKELHRTEIGDRGSDSPLLYNHKALLFEKDKDLLAFPVSVAKVTDEQRQAYGMSAWGSTVFQGAYVYNLTLEDGFKLQGSITQYPEGAFNSPETYTYGKDIERIIRVGTSFLTYSYGGLQSNSTEGKLAQQDKVEFKDDSVYPPRPMPMDGGIAE